MPAQPTKVYPVVRRYLNGVPAAAQTIPTKTEADELVETGAFTLDPDDPERDLDAPDLTGDEQEE